MSMLIQFLVLAAFLIITVGGGAVVGIINAKDFGDESPWYVALIKPSWNPPSWLFGPMWTVLYILMSFAAWLVWRKGGFRKQWRPLTFYFVQLPFNFAWVFIFGMAHALLLAFIELVVLWFLMLTTAVLFGRQFLISGLLLMPYLCWVAFAGALNVTLWSLNRNNTSNASCTAC